MRRTTLLLLRCLYRFIHHLTELSMRLLIFQGVLLPHMLICAHLILHLLGDIVSRRKFSLIPFLIRSTKLFRIWSTISCGKAGILKCTFVFIAHSRFGAVFLRNYRGRLSNENVFTPYQQLGEPTMAPPCLVPQRGLAWCRTTSCVSLHQLLSQPLQPPSPSFGFLNVPSKLHGKML